MRQKSGPQKPAAEQVIKDIRRATRKHHLRISLNWDSGFRKSRTSVSLSRGQRMRSISGCLVSVTGD